MQARPPWAALGWESQVSAQLNRYLRAFARYRGLSQLLGFTSQMCWKRQGGSARRFCGPEACHLFQDTAFVEDEKGELWKRKEYH